MKILLTGCAGFIGSNLASRCLEFGWRVIGVDDLSNGTLNFVPRGCEVLIDDFDSVNVSRRIVLQEFDCVFHLAACPRVSYSIKRPLITHDINVTKSLSLLNACRGNTNRLVFASSCSVYGNAKTIPTPETEVKDPRSPYALQKSIIEDYLKIYGSLYDLDSVSLRLFNVIGPNALGTSAYATALASWLTAIKKGEELRFDGDGSQSRDLCHVRDVANAFISIARSKKKFVGERYNVGSGTTMTNKELMQYLEDRYGELRVRHAPVQLGDVQKTQANVSAIFEDVGFKPEHTSMSGAQATCDWHDANWECIKNLNLGSW